MPAIFDPREPYPDSAGPSSTRRSPRHTAPLASTAPIPSLPSLASRNRVSSPGTACHHQGVVWSSMRSTHFTHQYPRRPGATGASGIQYPAGQGSPSDTVASSHPADVAHRQADPVAPVTMHDSSGPARCWRPQVLTGTPLHPVRVQPRCSPGSPHRHRTPKSPVPPQLVPSAPTTTVAATDPTTAGSGPQPARGGQASGSKDRSRRRPVSAGPRRGGRRAGLPSRSEVRARPPRPPARPARRNVRRYRSDRAAGSAGRRHPEDMGGAPRTSATAIGPPQPGPARRSSAPVRWLPSAGHERMTTSAAEQQRHPHGCRGPAQPAPTTALPRDDSQSTNPRFRGANGRHRPPGDPDRDRGHAGPEDQHQGDKAFLL